MRVFLIYPLESGHVLWRWLHDSDAVKDQATVVASQVLSRPSANGGKGLEF